LGVLLSPRDAAAQLDPLLFLKRVNSPSTASPAGKPNVLIMVDTNNRMQRDINGELDKGGLRPIASGQGHDGAITIHQDAAVYATTLARGERVEHALAPGRLGWVQMARGSLLLNDERLDQGDGAALEHERGVTLEALEPAEALLFDLPA
jgi:redox-sensitive bicupin YhaK (pirin superfamily)